VTLQIHSEISAEKHAILLINPCPLDHVLTVHFYNIFYIVKHLLYR